LHANDELIRELHAGRAFPGFSTALPLFPPTFKRIRHQVVYYPRSASPLYRVVNAVSSKALLTAVLISTHTYGGRR